MALQKAGTTKSAPPNHVPVSFSDEAMPAGGGFLDDQDVEITDAACTVSDFQGNAPPNTPVLAIEFTDVNGGEHIQLYSLGGFGKDPEFEPSEDGKYFYAIGGATAITKSSNAGRFIQSLKHGIPNKGDGGFPDEMLAEGNMKVLVGTKCHVFAEAQGGPKSLRRDKSGADVEKKIILVSKVNSLPGTDTTKKPTMGKTNVKAAGGKPNGAAATTTASAAATGDFAEIDAKLVEELTAALAENDPQPKKALLPIASAAFKGVKGLDGKDLHTKAIARANSPAFLNGLSDHGIAFDGAQFSLA